MDELLAMLGMAGSVLDTPGRFARTALSGRNPFASVFDPEQGASGRDMLETWGVLDPNTEGFDAGDVAGFGAEVLTDPLNLLGGALLGRTARGLGKATSAANKQNTLVDMATKAGAMPRELAEATIKDRFGKPKKLFSARHESGAGEGQFFGAPDLYTNADDAVGDWLGNTEGVLPTRVVTTAEFKPASSYMVDPNQLREDLFNVGLNGGQFVALKPGIVSGVDKTQFHEWFAGAGRPEEMLTSKVKKIATSPSSLVEKFIHSIDTPFGTANIKSLVAPRTFQNIPGGIVPRYADIQKPFDFSKMLPGEDADEIAAYAGHLIGKGDKDAADLIVEKIMGRMGDDAYNPHSIRGIGAKVDPMDIAIEGAEREYIPEEFIGAIRSAVKENDPRFGNQGYSGMRDFSGPLSHEDADVQSFVKDILGDVGYDAYRRNIDGSEAYELFDPAKQSFSPSIIPDRAKTPSKMPLAALLSALGGYNTAMLPQRGN